MLVHGMVNSEMRGRLQDVREGGWRDEAVDLWNDAPALNLEAGGCVVSGSCRCLLDVTNSGGGVFVLSSTGIW
jgi:hypothetical protein